MGRAALTTILILAAVLGAIALLQPDRFMAGLASGGWTYALYASLAALLVGGGLFAGRAGRDRPPVSRMVVHALIWLAIGLVLAGIVVWARMLGLA